MKRRWIFLGLSVAVMGVIFFFSSQQGAESAGVSGGLSSFVESVFFRRWMYLPEAEEAAQLGNLTFFLRKMAHFTLFFLLGGFLGAFFATFRLKPWLQVLLGALSATIYAALDEFHQALVPYRSFETFDIAVDAAGAFIGALIGVGLTAVALLSLLKKRQPGRDTGGQTT